MRRREALIARRKHLDFSQESLAHEMGVSVATIASWERGRRLPSPGIRRKLAEVLEVSLLELDRLLGVADPAQLGHDVPGWLSHYDSLVLAAGRLEVVEHYVLHGLLQIKEYAEAIERTNPLLSQESEIADRVDVRLGRQDAALFRSADPLDLTVVMPESVLREVVGGPHVMAEQLDHLVELSYRPNVDLRVLPADGRGAFAVNSFELLARHARRGAHFMAVTLDVGGPRYHEDPLVVQRFQTTYRHLLRVALPPTESVRRIEAIRESYQ